MARSLIQAVLPVTEAKKVDDATAAYPVSKSTDAEEMEESGEDDEMPSVPYNPFGLIFLCHLKVEVSVPHLRAGGPGLTIPTFKYIFGVSYEEIKFKYHSTLIVPPHIIAQKWIVTNKTKHTPTYINVSAEPEPNLFNLAEQGHTLPPPSVDSGSDMNQGSNGIDDTGGDIDAKVSQMWQQLLLDVTVKTPVCRGATNDSYFTVSKKDRLSAGEQLFNNNKLSQMWIACQFKIGDKDDWRLAFNHLFPPHRTQTSQKVQNYVQSKYYLMWRDICEITDAVTANAIHQQIWKKLFSLSWIPHACQDKMWPTSQKAGFTRLPPGSQGPAPCILVHTTPEWE